MKFLAMDLNNVKKLLEIIKMGNPPEGMTKQEWISKMIDCIKAGMDKMHPEIARTISIANANLCFAAADRIIEKKG